MNNQNSIVVVSLSVITIIIVGFWLFHDPTGNFSERIPGMDNRPAGGRGGNDTVNIGENFKHYKTVTSELKGTWTRFRGANFDNIVTDKTPLIDSWGDEGPKVIWTVDLGEGHAAPVIYNGKVYMLDYNETKRRDALRCFDLETGEELWRRSYSVHLKRNHGMSRSVPAITDSFLVTIGPRCHVMCTNPENGDMLWGLDMVKSYGTEVPFWYTGQCPLIENNTVILAPAGKSLMVALDCRTGEVVWETPNPKNLKMSHSSIMPMTFGGKKMYIYSGIGGIVGVSAEGSDIGEILWQITKWQPSVVAPSPLPLNNGLIYFTAGYGAGSMMLKLQKSGNKFTAKVIQELKPKDGISSEQQTPILYDGKLFGIMPKDGGALRNQLVCCEQDDCSKIIWGSGQTYRFGLGPYVIADGKFFILKDDGMMTIAKATTKKFEVLSQAKILDGHDAWGPLAIADGYLIMRDSKKMVCIDIRK